VLPVITLQLELPISALVAARDWSRAARGPSSAANHDHSTGHSAAAVNISTKARLAHFYAISATFDPTSRLLGALGRAATVKARLRAGDLVS
jgi:hypothetical protein